MSRHGYRPSDESGKHWRAGGRRVSRHHRPPSRPPLTPQFSTTSRARPSPPPFTATFNGPGKAVHLKNLSTTSNVPVALPEASNGTAVSSASGHCQAPPPATIPTAGLSSAPPALPRPQHHHRHSPASIPPGAVPA